MNKFLVLAGLFLLCAVMNLVNVLSSSNGFGLVMGALWLGLSIVCFAKYQKEKKSNDQEDKA